MQNAFYKDLCTLMDCRTLEAFEVQYILLRKKYKDDANVLAYVESRWSGSRVWPNWMWMKYG
jgi:hypothetical protein